MEKWQRKYITSNLPDLLTNTICNSELFSLLKSFGVFGDSDLDKLKAMRKSEGERAEVHLMYQILQTRTNAYKSMIRAFHDTNQTGARNILLHGYIQNDMKHVKIQGQNISLSEFFRKIDSGRLKELINSTMDKETIYGITEANAEFALITSTIPEDDEYYVPRTLTKRARLNMSILKENKKDIFVIKGISMSQLTKMVSPHIAERSSKQLDRVSVRHIMCELDQDFETICDKASPGSNLHFLEFEDDMLSWTRSHGSITSLHGYVHESQEKIDDNALVKHLLNDAHSQRHVCISDSPGMGKTVLLAKLANQISSHKNDTLVFFFVLREFVQHLSKKSSQATAEIIKDLMATKTSSTLFGKELVLCMLNSTDQRVEICLDGFDEILDSQIEVAKKLISVIRTDFKNTRLHITTRPHMRQEVEEALGSLGYNIQPFQEEAQINFLVSFWKFHISEPMHSNAAESLENFAKSCLKALKNKMNNIEKDIAGIPLQCRLLGEIYQGRAQRCLSSPNEDDEALVTSIFQIYCNLMKLRFERAKEQQAIREKSKLKVVVRVVTGSKTWLQKMKEVHYLTSLELLFPEMADTVKVVIQIDLKKFLSCREIYDIGLIESNISLSSSNRRFGHRTYSEFLAAEFIVSIMSSSQGLRHQKRFWTDFFKFLFDKVLKTQTTSEETLRYEISGINSRVDINRFDNSVITYFINCHLGDITLPSSGVVILCRQLLTMNIDDQTFHNSFVACAASNLVHLFRLLVSIFQTLKKGTFTLPAELAITAAKFSDFELNKEIHDLFSEDVNEFFKGGPQSHNLVSPMQVAVQRGNYAVVQVILNKYKSVCLSNNLLHVCLNGSSLDQFDTLTQKHEIINLLLDHNPQLCDYKLDHDDSTPILQPRVHPELMKLLFVHGADINATTKTLDNVLHKLLHTSVSHKIEEEYLLEMLTILKEFKFCGYFQVNAMGDSSLEMALKAADMGTRSLEFFNSVGTNFLFANDNDETLLFTAIANNQSLDCLKQLTFYGIDTQGVNSEGKSLLHIATIAGHIDAVEFILAKDNTVVNVPDADGNTPLHFAFSKESTAHITIRDILLKHGADSSAINNDKCTPVEYGLERSTGLTVNLATVKKMQETGFELSKETADRLIRVLLMNENAINWDIEGEYGELLRHLILIGGSVALDSGENPTDIKSINICISRIHQNLVSTYLDKDPESSLELLIKNALSETDKKLYSKFEHDKHSVEFTILVIVSLKDRSAFRLLHKAYQLVQSKSRFIDSNLADFYHTTNTNICVITTDCVPLTIAKFQEQIDSSNLIIDMAAFEKICKRLDRDVVVVATKTEIIGYVSAHTHFAHRIIFIQKANSIESTAGVELSNIDFCNDEFNWDSMSQTLRNEFLFAFKNVDQLNSYTARYGLEKLNNIELLNSDVFSSEFLIPMHVRNLLKDLFESDPLTNPTSSGKAVLQLIIKHFFPEVEHMCTTQANDDIDVPKEIKQLVFFGPTSSYLLALWIINNLSMLMSTDTRLLYELFSYKNVRLVTDHIIDSKLDIIETYEFKYWLVMYFLDKLVSKTKIQFNRIEVESELAEKLLHCCINLCAPHLLKLFSYEFRMDRGMLLVAAERGNIHLFGTYERFHKVEDSLNPISEESSDYHDHHYMAFCSALRKLHLDDIAYLAEMMEETSYLKLNKKLIVTLCKDNTVAEEDDIISRKLIALKLLLEKDTPFRDGVGRCLEDVKKTHPDILRYLILHGANPCMYADSTHAALIEILSSSSTPAEFHAVIKAIIKNGHHSFLRAKDDFNTLAISKIICNTEICRETLNIFVGILSNDELATCLQSAAKLQKESELLDAMTHICKSYEVKGNELHLSILSGNVKAVKFFIDQGAPVFKRCHCCGIEPLSLCITSPKFSIELFEILGESRAYIDRSIVESIAAQLTPKEFQGVVNVLVEKCYGHFFEPVAEFKQYNANFQIETINLVVSTIEGEMPEKCVYCSPIERSGSVLELEYIEKWLVEATSTCHKEHTPLHSAAKCGNVEAAEYLLNRGFKVNSKCNCCGGTPLHWSLQSAGKEEQMMKVISMLMRYDADMNQKNSSSLSSYEMALKLREDNKISDTIVFWVTPNFTL